MSRLVIILVAACVILPFGDALRCYECFTLRSKLRGEEYNCESPGESEAFDCGKIPIMKTAKGMYLSKHLVEKLNITATPVSLPDETVWNCGKLSFDESISLGAQGTLSISGIVRSCGPEDYLTICDTSDGLCTRCDTDLCNSSSSVYASIYLSLFSIVAVLMRS